MLREEKFAPALTSIWSPGRLAPLVRPVSQLACHSLIWLRSQQTPLFLFLFSLSLSLSRSLCTTSSPAFARLRAPPQLPLLSGFNPSIRLPRWPSVVGTCETVCSNSRRRSRRALDLNINLKRRGEQEARATLWARAKTEPNQTRRSVAPLRRRASRSELAPPPSARRCYCRHRLRQLCH